MSTGVIGGADGADCDFYDWFSGGLCRTGGRRFAAFGIDGRSAVCYCQTARRVNGGLVFMTLTLILLFLPAAVLGAALLIGAVVYAIMKQGND